VDTFTPKVKRSTTARSDKTAPIVSKIDRRNLHTNLKTYYKFAAFLHNLHCQKRRKFKKDRVLSQVEGIVRLSCIRLNSRAFSHKLFAPDLCQIMKFRKCFLSSIRVPGEGKD